MRGSIYAYTGVSFLSFGDPIMFTHSEIKSYDIFWKELHILNQHSMLSKMRYLFLSKKRHLFLICCLASVGDRMRNTENLFSQISFNRALWDAEFDADKDLFSFITLRRPNDAIRKSKICKVMCRISFSSELH